MISGGTQVHGRFPKTSSAKSVLYRRTDGKVTHYMVYDAKGLPVKRVDITGKPHAGVNTPHVVHFVENTAPNGRTFRSPEKTVRPARAEEIPGGARSRIFGKKSGSGKASKAAGTGGTDKFGNYWYSTKGTKQQQRLAKYHEQVHSVLSPKLKLLRNFRATIGEKAYLKSHLLRYLEEMLAEAYAQLRVKGLRGLPDAIRFPVTHGYVRVSRVALEGAAAVITVGGIAYGVHITVNKK